MLMYFALRKSQFICMRPERSEARPKRRGRSPKYGGEGRCHHPLKFFLELPHLDLPCTNYLQPLSWWVQHMQS